MLAKSCFKISGIIQNESYFTFHEGNSVDLDKIHDVLTGQLLGTVFHNALPAAESKTIANNFWNSEISRKQNDGVPAISVGAYHYKKDLVEYFKQVELAKPHVTNLFHGTINIVEPFIEKLTTYFEKKNVCFRAASHDNREASKFVIRSCNAFSDFVISPHDDIAQCTMKSQRGFEIEKIPNYEMIAVNMCLENHNGGQLHIWNMQPDNETRSSLNIEETGYPYPPNLVNEFNEIIMPIRTGDLYCFNGRNIHAVKSKIKSDKYRTTITFFMGYIDSKTIIYWT